MSEPKFTPGPWIVEGFDEHLGYDCMTAGVRIGPVVLDGEDYGQVRCKEMSAEAKERMMADAHMISAVTEMYAALNELVSTIIIDDEEGLATFLDPIQRAQAALAKARGE
jgi:hypothetical protein